jgi:hypothetical protein
MIPPGMPSWILEGHLDGIFFGGPCPERGPRSSFILGPRKGAPAGCSCGTPRKGANRKWRSLRRRPSARPHEGAKMIIWGAAHPSGWQAPSLGIKLFFSFVDLNFWLGPHTKNGLLSLQLCEGRELGVYGVLQAWVLLRNTHPPAVCVEGASFEP